MQYVGMDVSLVPRPPPRLYLGCEIKSGRRPGNEAIVDVSCRYGCIM